MLLVLEYVIFFTIYSFLGWILDTGYRSITAGKYDPGSFFPIPFCPVYGLGALLILFLNQFFAPLPLVVEFLLYGVILALLEFLTGVFLKRVFHKTLWKYTDTPLNIQKFTDLPHALAWGAIALFVLYELHPLIVRIVESFL